MDASEARFKIVEYINHNPLAAIGTVNEDGTPHGAVLYVVAMNDASVYFITKNGTQKYQNLTKRPAVSITIGNDRDSSTLQASGTATILTDAMLMETVMDKITTVHAQMAEWLPPIAKLRAGAYAIVKVTLGHARLAEFRGLNIGSEQIFTELRA